jgi:hypothetical protein
VGLERGPLNLMNKIEELLARKSSGSGLGNREYVSRDPSRLPRCTLDPRKLAPTSPTNGGFSVGIVRSRTEATEFFSFRIKCTWFRLKKSLCTATMIMFEAYMVFVNKKGKPYF